MPKLSVVVVNYNVRDFLAQTLRTVRAATAALDAEVWVVDNASTDGSVEMVRRDFPEVRLVASGTNLGFAKANNLALAQCAGEFIALVNPDTLIRDDTFTVCLDYLASRPDAGMVGCKILNPDGTLQLACRRSFPTPGVALAKVLGLSALFPRSRRFGRYNLTFLDPDQEAEVEAISGSFMVFRRSILDEVGPLDERFFMYGEDLDFCYRIHQAGWKIVYLPSTEIIHYKGQSTLQRGFRSLLTFYEAMGLFVEKHFHHGWIWLPRWLLLAGIGLRAGVSFWARTFRPWARPLADGLALQTALILAHLWRFNSLDHLRSYLPVDALYTATWLTMLAFSGRYRTRKEGVHRIAGGMALGLIFNTSLTFFMPQYAFSRLVLAAMGALGGLLLLSGEEGLALLRRGRKRRHAVKPRVLFAGAMNSQRRLAEDLQEPKAPYRVVGFLDWEGEAGGLPAHHVLGPLAEAPRLMALHKVDQLIFPFEKAGERPILQALQWKKARSVTLKVTLPPQTVSAWREAHDVRFGLDLGLIRFRIDEPLYRICKRGMDLLLCLVTALPVAVGRLFEQSSRWRLRPFSDGNTGSLTLRWPGDDAGPWKRWMAFWPWVLRGTASWVGGPLAFYPHPGGDTGYKPGWTSAGPLDFYLMQYHPWMDVKRLVQAIKKTDALGI